MEELLFLFTIDHLLFTFLSLITYHLNMFFIKFEGFGNDYIVFEAEQVEAVSDLNDLARRVCDRHYGAGADGITVVRASSDESADFEVRIFNPDGSEADLSGNGTRCTVAYLHYRRIWEREEL